MGLERKMCEERLRSLVFLNLEKKKLEGQLNCFSSCAFLLIMSSFSRK